MRPGSCLPPPPLIPRSELPAARGRRCHHLSGRATARVAARSASRAPPGAGAEPGDGPGAGSARLAEPAVDPLSRWYRGCWFPRRGRALPPSTKTRPPACKAAQSLAPRFSKILPKSGAILTQFYRKPRPTGLPSSQKWDGPTRRLHSASAGRKLLPGSWEAGLRWWL